MKRVLMTLTLLVTLLGLTALAGATTIFDSKSYVQGDAGLIGPLEGGERSTNLSGPAPDFAKDYAIGEGGLVNPVDKPMEK